MSKPVMCPCCGKTLFNLGALSADPPVQGKHRTDPKLQSDQHGQYMCCPHCSKRVIFVTAPSATGVGFRVGDVQPCADCGKNS